MRPTISTSSTCGSISISTAWPTPCSRSMSSPDELGRRQSVRKRVLRPADDAEDREAGPGALESRNRRALGRSSIPSVTNAVGEPVGYKFMPGDNALPDRLAERLVAEAGWLREPSRLGHALLATTKSYGAGDYPNQSRGGDGLIAGRSRTGRSTTPTSSSGTRSATRTFRGRKIIPSCRPPTSASC